jgi:hypothetical protein
MLQFETNQFQNSDFSALFFGGVGLLFVAVVIAAFVQQRRHKQEMLEIEQQLGFTRLAQPDPLFTDRMRRAYPSSDHARFSNLAFLRRDDLTIYLFDVTTRRNSGGRSQSGSDEGVIALISPQLNLPPFLMISHITALENIGLVAGMVDLALKQVGLSYGYRKVPFAIDSEFDRRYLLLTNNDEAVKAFFNDALVSHLAQTDGYVVRASGDTLLFGSFYMQRPKNSDSRNPVVERIQQAHQLYDWILNDR